MSSPERPAPPESENRLKEFSLISLVSRPELRLMVKTESGSTYELKGDASRGNAIVVKKRGESKPTGFLYVAESSVLKIKEHLKFFKDNALELKKPAGQQHAEGVTTSRIVELVALGLV